MATTCSKKRIRTKAVLAALAAFKAMAVESLFEHINTLLTIHDESAVHVGSEY